MVGDLKELSIMINSFGDITGFEVVDEASKKLQTTIEGTQFHIQSFTKNFLDLSNAGKEVSKDFGQYVDYTKIATDATLDLSEAGKEVNNNFGKFTDYADAVSKPIYSFQESQKNAAKTQELLNAKIREGSKQLKNMIYQQTRFRMEYLSIMFYGMQVERTFRRILDAGTEMFKKVMEASGNTTGAIFQLSAGIDYLKFTLGMAINTALEPLMPLILNIINTISDWIDKNPKLAAGIILGALALGMLMFQIAQLGLFINGLKILLMNLPPMFSAIGTAGLAGLAPLLPLILLIAVAIGVLIMGWEYFAEAGRGALDFLAGIMEGDTDKMTKGFIRFISNLLIGMAVGVTQLAAMVGKLVFNVVAWLSKMAITIGMWILKSVSQLLMAMIAAVAEFPGLLWDALTGKKDALGLYIDKVSKSVGTVGVIFDDLTTNITDNMQTGIGVVNAGIDDIMKNMARGGQVLSNWVAPAYGGVGIGGGTTTNNNNVSITFENPIVQNQTDIDKITKQVSDTILANITKSTSYATKYG